MITCSTQLCVFGQLTRSPKLQLCPTSRPGTCIGCTYSRMGIMDLKGYGCRVRLPGLVFHCTRIFTRIVIKRCFALIPINCCFASSSDIGFQISQVTTKQITGLLSRNTLPCLNVVELFLPSLPPHCRSSVSPSSTPRHEHKGKSQEQEQGGRCRAKGARSYFALLQGMSRGVAPLQLCKGYPLKDASWMIDSCCWCLTLTTWYYQQKTSCDPEQMHAR